MAFVIEAVAASFVSVVVIVNSVNRKKNKN